jgi:CHAD domain-containing protein
MASVHPEVEYKFEAARGPKVPELAGIDDVATVEGPLSVELDATYFDTPGLALAGEGITLRRRVGGGDAGWHLKIPVGASSRDELRLPLSGTAVEEVPGPLREAVQLYARGQDLTQVAQIKTRRKVYRLRDSDAETLLEVCDDGVTARTPATDAYGALAAWREWEVELVAGKTHHLEAAAQVLEQAGAQPAVERSKLARALGDRLPRTAGGAEDPMRLDSPAADVVQARLQEQVAEFKYRDPLVRHNAPDAVHKMRVAMRRLRSALATFRPLLDREQTEPLREELKWIAGVLGAARDAEVMHERLTDLVAEQPVELVIGPVKRGIDLELRTAYRTAHERSVEAMQSQRYFALVDRLDALVADPPWTPKASETVESVLPGRVAKDYRRLRRRVAAADKASDQATRNERLHEVRKAAKRVRYAAETMVPVYGRPATRFAKAAKRVQSILGDQHDAVVAQAELRQIGVRTYLDGENAYTYGLLQGVEQANAVALDAKYRQASKRASRRNLRRWLS